MKIKDDYHQIFWQRVVTSERAARDGTVTYFIKFGLNQHFDVWGYSVREALDIIEAAGLAPDGVSDRLDFATAGTEESNPFCLNFRAGSMEES